MNTFRVRRYNELNWTLEEWIPGGLHPVTKQPGSGKWVITGYYGKLKDLAVYLLNRQIEVPEGTLGEQVPALIEAIKAAEVRIAETLTAVMEA